MHPVLTLIEQRAAAGRFDATHSLSGDAIARLVDLATRAPTAYHLQNWRFIAVQTAEAKARLRALAWDQPKVEEAAVTFIVCGVLPDAANLPHLLRPAVAAGFMPPDMPDTWKSAAATQYANPRIARDEAVRSAALGAATLMLAAEGLGLASGPMGGFDAAGVGEAFCLGPDEIPVMLVAVGRPALGNWPQKQRRPVADVLSIA